jgi:hypothetical protein
MYVPIRANTSINLKLRDVIEAQGSRESFKANLYTRWWVNGASGVDNISTPRICTSFIQLLTPCLRTLNLDLRLNMCVPYGHRGRQ